jgi:hypothetical protein
MKLYNTLNNLILEIATADQITDAIRNKKVCVIYYNGDEPGGKGLRVIEPVAYGYSKKGNPVLRAWDREGASHKAYLGKNLYQVGDFLEWIKWNLLDPPKKYSMNQDQGITRQVIRVWKE